MRRRGSLQQRGIIGYSTPVTFGNRSTCLQPTSTQIFSLGFLTAICLIVWLLSPYMDE